MLSLMRFGHLTSAILALRNMVARRSRTILTGIGIALGVAIVLAVNVTNATLLSSFDAVFDEAGGQADLTVIDRARGGQGFDADILDRVSRGKDVVAAAPAVQAFTLPADDVNDWQASYGVAGTLAAGSQLLLMGIDAQADASVRDLTLVTGCLLEPGEQRYSVVLVENYADDHDYTVGDKLPILLPGGQGIARLTIIGLIKRSGAGLINGGAVAFLPLPVAQELLDRRGRLDRIDVVLADQIADSSTALAEAKDQLAAVLGDDVRIIYPGARGEELAKRMTSYRLGLDLLSLIAMFVGGFLIYNTFAMNVAERTRDIGLLRAIGMTRRQILTLVMIEAGILCLVSSIVGISMGLGMAQGLSSTLSVIAGSAAIPMTVTAKSFTRSLILGIGVTLISALGPAIQATGISPLQALRARAKTEAGTWERYGRQFGPGMLVVGWIVFNYLPLRQSVAWTVTSLASLVFLLGAAFLVPLAVRPLIRAFQPAATWIFGHAGSLGTANVQRAQSRTVLTVATLMLGIGMNIGITSLGDSFRYDLSRYTEAATGGDLIVYSPVRIERRTSQRLAAVDGVELLTPERYVEAWTAGASTEDEIVYVAIDPETRQQISQFIFESSWQDTPANAFARLREGEAVFLSTTLSSRYHLGVGDQIELDTPRGTYTFEVVGVVVDFTGNGMMVYGSWRDLRDYFGVDDADRLILQMAPGFEPLEVKGRIESQLGERLNLTVEAVDELMRDTLEIVDQSFVMFDTLALVVVGVSAMGVVNTMTISVMERQREIAMLRSIGYTRRQVRRMILAEAASLGVMGGGLGLVLGLALSRMCIQVVQQLAGYELTYVLSSKALISSVVIALVISQVAALLPATHAAKKEIVAALKEE